MPYAQPPLAPDGLPFPLRSHQGESEFTQGIIATIESDTGEAHHSIYCRQTLFSSLPLETPTKHSLRTFGDYAVWAWRTGYMGRALPSTSVSQNIEQDLRDAFDLPSGDFLTSCQMSAGDRTFEIEGSHGITELSETITSEYNTLQPLWPGQAQESPSLTTNVTVEGGPSITLTLTPLTLENLIKTVPPKGTGGWADSDHDGFACYLEAISNRRGGPPG